MRRRTSREIDDFQIIRNPFSICGDNQHRREAFFDCLRNDLFESKALTEEELRVGDGFQQLVAHFDHGSFWRVAGHDEDFWDSAVIEIIRELVVLFFPINL